MNKKMQEKGITLIALVVTIVVLLILAGVSITLLWGDNGILKTTQDATIKFGIELEREKIDNVQIEWWTKKAIGNNVTVEDFFTMLKEAGIIEDRTDVTGPDEDNIYIVKTNSGYTVEIILEKDGNIKIGDIAKGALSPVIRKIEISSTNTSIKAKAIVSRLENGSIEYWCKVATENDSEYKKMTNLEEKEGAIIDLTPEEGITYKIKVIAQNEAGEHEDTAEITIGLKVKTITLDKTSAIVRKDYTLQLNPIITPKEAENKAVTWSSSNDKIATVDENGLITAKTEGEVKVIATTTDGSNLTATCNVIVPIEVIEITLNKTTETVVKGKKVTLTATVKPDNATKQNVTWTSSSNKIATVNSSGIVTGISAGDAIITATATDGSEVSASCKITVEKSSLAKLVGKPAQATNLTVSDDFGNQVVVPAGFTVQGNKVGDIDYKYIGDGDPSVQDGVVIQDNIGNQYVWIPVGTIINKNGTSTTITLGRYSFNTSDRSTKTRTSCIRLSTNCLY